MELPETLDAEGRAVPDPTLANLVSHILSKQQSCPLCGGIIHAREDPIRLKDNQPTLFATHSAAIVSQRAEPTPEKTEQPQADRSRTAETYTSTHAGTQSAYRERYSNSVQIRVSLWDFIFCFGLIGHEGSVDPEIQLFQAIYLSPQQAKAFWLALQNNVSQYEATFGPIQVALQADRESPS
jgi:hypothetical protein